MVRAKRRLAQHFLESSWVERLVAVVAPEPTDVILEIGPGRGALTLALARSGARVVAVEVDRELATELGGRVPANVTVVTDDFLHASLEDLTGLPLQNVRVVGNLPYNVASPMLLKLLRLSRDTGRFRDATLMVQREVAERIIACPGTRDWGPLAIATQLQAEAAPALTVPPGAFRPMPKVTSAVVTLRFRSSPVPIRDRALFDRFVRTLFTQRRKTAVNAARRFMEEVGRLPPEEVFAKAGVDPRMRPAELQLSELADLSEVLASEAR